MVPDPRGHGGLPQEDLRGGEDFWRGLWEFGAVSRPYCRDIGEQGSARSTLINQPLSVATARKCDAWSPFAEDRVDRWCHGNRHPAVQAEGELSPTRSRECARVAGQTDANIVDERADKVLRDVRLDRWEGEGDSPLALLGVFHRKRTP